MRISIALATYNGARFLEQQLDSLARQTCLPEELVVCDDGSSDGTAEIVRVFAASAVFPVRFIQNPRNLGWKDNFLKAAGLCRGDWVAFCDQDDVWMPDKLERLAQVATLHPEVLLMVHAAAVAYENLERTGELLPDVRRFRVVPALRNRPWDMPAGFACCFRRSLLDQVPLAERPHDPNWPEDRLSHCKLVYMLANAWGSVAYLPEVLAVYRRHPKAVTGRGAKGRPERRFTHVIEGRLRTGAAEYAKLARCAEEFADFVGGFSPGDRARAQPSRRAAAYYRLLASGLRSRAALYERSQLAARARAFAELVSSGGYAQMGAAHFGVGALTKDATVVAFTPLLALLRRVRSAAPT